MSGERLTEAEVRSRYITPAITGGPAKWDLMTQIREEFYFTKGRIIVRGKTVQRGEALKADYLLCYRPNLPLAVIEAKDTSHALGDGMQQALKYAEILDVPFAYSSNGTAFLEHDRTGNSAAVEREIPLDQFPSPEELWRRYCRSARYAPSQLAIVTQDYYDDGSGRTPHYYQRIAINRTVDAIARGENRILLVMATGTGKTYTAFQIIWRLWKSGAKKRILFLVDRNVLADQTKTNDFKPFGQAMTKITHRTVDKSYEIYLCLYQAVTGSEEEKNIYKQFSPDFFDLVIVDECHRGSAAEDASWRKVLEYFSSATQIGMTATPKETRDVSNIEYFGDPIYTYSLRQGIADGFLAPYKVVRITTDRDAAWRPPLGTQDKYGNLVEDREYNLGDYDRGDLVLEQRTELVARKVTQFLKVRESYASLDQFLCAWNEADRKKVILEELAAKGVFLDELAELVGRDYDTFDLVAHVAFDQKPLTRKERAARVQKRDVFGKYREQARAVLAALLEKYADAGITSMESLDILKVDPLRSFGTPIEILNLFGGKPGYLAALRDLEKELYQEAA